MQTFFAIAALVSITSAFTPSQVKEDLDTHPWRPEPGVVPKSTPATPTDLSTTAVPTASAPNAAFADTGVWQLQIAAFSSLEAARSEQKRLEKIFGPGKIEILTEGAVNRVRFGGFPTKQAAEAAREEIRLKGVEGFPVHKP